MDIAKCVRIFEPEPDDDFVTKRTKAIQDLKTRLLKKRSIADQAALGSGICQVFRDSPSIPDSIATQVGAAIKKQSASFVQDGRDVEMGVCAAAAIVQAVESRGKAQNALSMADILAVAIWSSLSFLPPCNAPKLEELRVLAVDAGRNRSLKAGLATRDRHYVPAFGSDESDSETFVSDTRYYQKLWIGENPEEMKKAAYPIS